jgi:hypothetical protein
MWFSLGGTMKSLPDNARFGGPTKSSLNVRTLVIFVGISIGLDVAIYAMTVDPNSAIATMGFPP